MRIIRYQDCRVMPWKNGGGSTTEIAIHPEGASLDDFDWRISMADVASDGPFSLFPGVDRTLSVLTGNGIALAFGAHGTVTLRPGSAPHAFAGDAAVVGELIDGPITDLNVMTRRGRVRHRVRRLSGPAPIAIAPEGELLVLFAGSGEWRAKTTGGTHALGARDSLVIEAGESASLDCGDDAGELYAIDLWTGALR
ncbi:HutD/Ves family protein [Bosea sp. (in: a-proteobacteria)]|uniref:HutD/Ves family protein n=1 Tax=Bosea sp. (in: a-proteobacteria) TaxID=1871050 RepID=UPI002FC964EA